LYNQTAYPCANILLAKYKYTNNAQNCLYSKPSIQTFQVIWRNPIFDIGTHETKLFIFLRFLLERKNPNITPKEIKVLFVMVQTLTTCILPEPNL